MRRFLKLLAAIGGGACLAAFVAAPAFAGNIDAPTGNPFAWPGDASGNPVYRDVTVSGFPAGSTIFLEVCDGSDPQVSGWDPTEHCDLASSPAGLPGPGGTFQASDANHKFRPFKGESPQGIFICKSPNDPAPPNPNGLPVFTNCKVRASTNNSQSTSDQTFLNITLPDAAGGGEVPEVPFALVLPLGAVAIGGAFLVIRKRRAAHAAA